MGEAGLKTRTRFGNAALMISANVPDLDVLVFFTDTSSLAFRRGWTHGVAAQLVLPVALTGVFWAIDRLRPRPGGTPPFRAGWMLALAYFGVYSHVFLDFLNTYGVRLLTPFDWRWFYGDSVFIVDPWLWIALGLGIWLSRRRHGTRPARWSLAIAGCYIAAMIVSARMAGGIVAEAWRDARDTDPLAIMVGPVPITPLRRDVIVDAGDHYEVGRFSWIPARATFGERLPKNDTAPEVGAARQDPNIAAFLVWSRFPYWDVQRSSEGSRVVVRDVRFMGAGSRFGAAVTLSTPPGS